MTSFQLSRREQLKILRTAGCDDIMEANTKAFGSISQERPNRFQISRSTVRITERKRL